MPTSPQRKAEAERVAGRVRELVGQGLDRGTIMVRLGISKGHAARLIKEARDKRLVKP